MFWHPMIVQSEACELQKSFLFKRLVIVCKCASKTLLSHFSAIPAAYSWGTRSVVNVVGSRRYAEPPVLDQEEVDYL